MSIKAKTGICLDCGKERHLIQGRCQGCYWPYRRSLKRSKPKEQAKEARGKALGTFFASQTLIMPEFCEESGQRLPKSPSWLKRACIAHILKKRADFGFPSVATHPMNKIFLHPDIHANMDNLGEQYIMKMKSLPVMKERVKILLPFLTEEERNRVPEYLL